MSFFEGIHFIPTDSTGGMRNFATVWFSWKKLVLEPSGGNVSSIICFLLESSFLVFVIMAFTILEEMHYP